MGDIPLSNMRLFSKGKGLPSSMTQFFILLISSISFGILSMLFIHIKLETDLVNIVISGVIVGIIGITIPTLLSVITIKSMKQYVKTKYILLIALIAAIAYSIFLLAGSAIFALTNSYGYLLLFIFVGDAGTFMWWFLMSKLVLNQRLKAIPISFIQPTLNALFLIPTSIFLISATIPIKFVFIRLYSGILIFIAISYIVMYLIDSPIKKGLGISGIDVFSQVIQNWLFQANITFSSSEKVEVDIGTDTLLFKRNKNSIKSIMFTPQIHYGLMGTIGSSNFPWLLEKYATLKYKAQTFVMHSTVSEEYNAFSSDQYKYIKNALDSGINESNKMGSGIKYYESQFGYSRIIMLKFGNTGLITLTRAPRVTEDISTDAGEIIRKSLERIVDNPIVIDAHNSRYETAPKSELEGIDTKSEELQDYIKAIKGLIRPKYTSTKIILGTSNIEAYKRLGEPVDLAKGALNTTIFSFKGFKFCMLQFNANNMSPRLRKSIINHIKEKYGIYSELYTTDTHYVISLSNNAKNVLGNHTKYKMLEPLIDEAVEAALNSTEQVYAYHKSITLKRFRIWGLDRDSIVNVMRSMLSITRLLVPLTIIIGFFIAALFISAI